jgi:hypothetical protein
LCGRGSIVQALPQSGFPAPDTGDKKFNSRLVVPIWKTSGLFYSMAVSRFSFGTNDLQIHSRPRISSNSQPNSTALRVDVLELVVP